MKYAVVDTNVLVVANGESEQADYRCLLEAKRLLRYIRDHGSLVLDDAWRILGEYQRNVGGRRQPGVGSRFFKWAATLAHTRRVVITCHPDRGFVEFPRDPRLVTFHRDDRKFVAATVASGLQETELLNAVDSDYADSRHRVALAEAGVRVRELCPHSLKGDR